MAMTLSFDRVTFSHDALDDALFADLSVTFSPGWTGIVGANGSGKTTLLQLATGELSPARGQVHRPARMVLCAQRTDAPPELLAEFLAALDPLARELTGRLHVGADCLRRWPTLSHGERKRAQLAVALWQQPAVLAVDEPSNHIDAEARELLLRALGAFPGIGLLVSHDRTMLDRLCRACLFVEPPEAVLRPGTYTTALAQHRRDLAHRRAQREQAQREVRRLHQTLVARRETAAREHRDRSKRGLPPGDHDARAKINGARVADSGAGAPLRQLAGRMAQASARLAGLVLPPEYDSGIFLPDCRSRRDLLCRLPPGTLALGGPARTLAYPELLVAPTDRIALTGANGSGKSTLLGHLVRQLVLPPERLLYLPQEIPAEAAAALIGEARALRGDRLGLAMAIIRRLGSDPPRLLRTALPSPGEARKLLLALGIARQTHLIVMDEPTNHLDLPSIECLEEALAPCPCGLLLVSHDLAFLRRLTTRRWHLAPVPDAPGHSCLVPADDWP
jgi:ATPase subunit of ABC transporter with duplicated ATPase domains